MKCLVIIVSTLSAICSYSQNSVEAVSADHFKRIIYALADDSMCGRASGSSEEKMSLNYISKEFKKLSTKSLKYHDFKFQLDSTNFYCQNGYYFLNNHAKKTIVLGAHYDHIGLGGALSMSMTSNEIHNGADDNASGVAMLLALSKSIPMLKKGEMNYLFVFYSGHELGLFGSSHFVQFIEKKKRKFKTISTAINFDMVGRFDASSKVLKCMRSESLDSLLLSSLSPQYGIELKIADAERLKSLDTKAFVENGIPCLNFTTGSHDDYHKTSDDAKYINYEGLVTIHAYITGLLTRF
jgi:aminopeptidase-like protein